jgi:simple sugar transport system ATP-binding protein
VTENPPALVLESIDKWFGTVRALTDARLWVRRGTVHAVLGENGAGKTTLMRVAYGMATPDRGVVRVHGHAVRLRSPADAIERGIGMVHQHFTLVPTMTVAENLALDDGRGESRTRQSRDPSFG